MSASAIVTVLALTVAFSAVLALIRFKKRKVSTHYYVAFAVVAPLSLLAAYYGTLLLPAPAPSVDAQPRPQLPSPEISEVAAAIEAERLALAARPALDPERMAVLQRQRELERELAGLLEQRDSLESREAVTRADRRIVSLPTSGTSALPSSDAISQVSVPPGCRADARTLTFDPLRGQQRIEVTIRCPADVVIGPNNELRGKLEDVRNDLAAQSEVLAALALERDASAPAGGTRLKFLAAAAREAGATYAPEPTCRDCEYAGMADVRHSDPGVLWLEKPEEIGLALVPRASPVDADEVLDAARFAGDIISDEPPVRYSLKMRARLRGPAIDFRVEPTGWQVREVLDGTDPMTWSWTATPLRPGPDKILTIEIQSLLAPDGEEPRAFGNTSRSIEVEVDVSPWGRAVYMANEVTAVQVALGGVGAMLVGAVSWLIAFVRGLMPTAFLRSKAAPPHRRGSGERAEERIRSEDG